MSKFQHNKIMSTVASSAKGLVVTSGLRFCLLNKSSDPNLRWDFQSIILLLRKIEIRLMYWFQSVHLDYVFRMTCFWFRNSRVDLFCNYLSINVCCCKINLYDHKSKIEEGIRTNFAQNGPSYSSMPLKFEPSTTYWKWC